MNNNRIKRAGFVAVALSVLLAACGSPAAPAATTAPTTAPAIEATAAATTETTTEATTEATAAATAAATTEATPAATAEATAAMTGTTATTATMPTGSPGQEYTDALAGKFRGTQVTVDGPFAGEDATKFDATMKAFEEATGIDIVYEGGKEFEKAISVRVDGGNPPDIADFPQPGLLARFVAQGKIVDLSDKINQDWLQANYAQSWLDMSMMPGQNGDQVMAGVWQRVNGKSLVWYPKKAFDDAGYAVPTTWAEMQALMDQIVADGDTPWCIGIESGAATGWPATDWMEEMMLRTTSPENYDRWVAGELKFNSPEVKKAAEAVSAIWFNDQYVFGGRQSIASTNFGDAPKPMFDQPDPKCWLHKQGNFITTFFPQTAQAGVDYDFFYLPGLDAAYGSPVLVAGDIMAMFNDRPEVRAVMQYFTLGENLRVWMEQGGAIAPHRDADPAWYGSEIERKIGEIIGGATAVRFDGSDLMPGEVGAGSFWKGMTDWVSGSIELDAALTEIDNSWPK
jgi:alpha-glucoside transport system substrate-binding protein